MRGNYSLVPWLPRSIRGVLRFWDRHGRMVKFVVKWGGVFAAGYVARALADPWVK